MTFSTPRTFLAPRPKLPYQAPYRSVEEICAAITPVDQQAFRAAQTRLDAKTKPRRSLGLVEDLACRLAAIYGSDDPAIPEPAVVILAGDHGVAEEGVSAYPQEVTAQMVDNIAGGGAACNVLARHVGALLVVVNMGTKHITRPAQQGGAHDWSLAAGTNNFVHGPAMSREYAAWALENGDSLAMMTTHLRKLLAIGDMGIANTTSASALTAVLTGVPPEEVTGRGTGIDEPARLRKIQVIRRALEVNRPDPHDALDVLAKLGGFEIAGLVGLILGAASRKVPVILDGFITGAAALVAAGLCPAVKDYCIAAHGSTEPGHRVILRHLGLRPLLDLDMRLGEATGALLAVPLVTASLRILKDMATFSAAGVTDTGA